MPSQLRKTRNVPIKGVCLFLLLLLLTEVQFYFPHCCLISSVVTCTYMEPIFVTVTVIHVVQVWLPSFSSSHTNSPAVPVLQ